MLTDCVSLDFECGDELLWRRCVRCGGRGELLELLPRRCALADDGEPVLRSIHDVLAPVTRHRHQRHCWRVWGQCVQCIRNSLVRVAGDDQLRRFCEFLDVRADQTWPGHRYISVKFNGKQRYHGDESTK